MIAAVQAIRAHRHRENLKGKGPLRLFVRMQAILGHVTK